MVHAGTIQARCVHCRHFTIKPQNSYGKVLSCGHCWDDSWVGTCISLPRMFNKLATDCKWPLTRDRAWRRWRNWEDCWVAVNASRRGLTTRPVAAEQSPSVATWCPGDQRTPTNNANRLLCCFWDFTTLSIVSIITDSINALTNQINQAQSEYKHLLTYRVRRYVVIAMKHVHRLQICPIVHN